ncbi:M23 family metallopeptidase [Endozoicomonas montiporae]|uniref:M23 family metallopeptidase n=1 Tax=Endozoicomonas montiporae TaxID=1027273 RepID=UPI001FD4AC0A|nr:M23 family metallopeptidase [Endozoicomonas montiporae]
MLTLLMVFCSLQVFASDTGRLSSRLKPGGFYVGVVKSGTEVHYKGRQVRVSDDGQFIIGFGRDAELQQSFKLLHNDGRSEKVSLALKSREYDIQHIDGVARKYVQPAPDVLHRIRTEAKRVGQSRQFDTPADDFFSGFTQPARGRITGIYGSQRYFNGEPRRPHYGIDFAAPTGHPVVSAADGIVRLAHEDLYFSGGTIIIDHGFGISSSYLHLSAIDVKEGETVERGQLIGKIGATGRVTGPHLDWRINWFDVRLDPALMMQ